jgi:hypothetical protein
LKVFFKYFEPTPISLAYAYVLVPYRLVSSYLKLSSGKLLRFRAIWQAFGALMFLSEAKGRGGKAAWASFTVNTLRSNAKRIHSLRVDREQSEIVITRLIGFWLCVNQMMEAGEFWKFRAG